MSIIRETNISRFVCLSTDTKPTGVPSGSYLWESDTNILYKTYDGTAWLPTVIKSLTQPSAETQSFRQGAASYPLYTATGGSVMVESFTLTNTINHSADAGTFTGISVETDSTTVVVLVAQAAGVKAGLTAGKVFTYSVPFALLVGKKITYTIYGGQTAANPAGFTVTCRYQPINPAGYMA
jgi:hypothetical protein